ncbi:MAG: hypothetical protein MUF21_06390 [Gemmatimonadaceae bacterium]|nr:hypothetical protein [Gemmatimonadaceae bacterium]
MRAPALLLLAAVGTGALVAARPAPARAARHRDVAEVTIGAKCLAPGESRIVVTPDTLVIAQGESVSWAIEANSRVEAIAIRPKNQRSWLFEERPPYTGTRTTPAVASRMRADARGRYSYNVTVTCRDSTGQTWMETLDPDIIVN